MVKPTIMIVAVAVVVVVLVVAIVGLGRVSQSDLDRAKYEADLHTEKAIRLLDKYQANVSEIALLREQLGRQLSKDKTPVAVPPKGNDMQELVRGALEEFQTFSREMSKRAKQDPGAEPVLSLGQNEAQISRGLEAATKKVDQLIAENAKLLKQALQEADAALQVQVGTASMREHVAANQVKACVLYVQGMERRNESLLRRLESQQVRLRALRLIDQSARLLARVRDVEDRKPVRLKKDLADEAAELKKRLTAAQEQADGLKKRIDEMRRQIAAAQAEAAAAGQALQALEQTGYDPKNPADVKRYVDEYSKQAAIQQQAAVRTMALQNGTLEGAKLDDAHGGDFLEDKYVAEPGGKGMTPVKGLSMLEADLKDVNQHVAEIEALLKANVQRTAQTKELEAQLAALGQKLGEEKKAVDQQVLAAMAEAESHATKATEIENHALAQLDNAAKAYAQASRASGGRGDVVLADPALKELARDRDTDTVLAMDQADIAYLQALVHLQRVRGLSQQIDAMRLAEAAEIAGLDKARTDQLGGELAKAREAALKAVDDSIKLGEKAQFQGNLKWIGQASIAGAYHLKSLLAEGSASAEALDKAIDTYAAAVEKKESSPFLRPHVRMLAYLRAGGGVQSRPSASRPATGTATQPGSQPAGATAFNPIAASKQVIEFLATGQFDAVAKQFNAEMKAKLSVQMLGETWKTVVAQVGAFEKPLKTQAAQAQDMRIVMTTCKFAKAEMEIMVAYDKADLIAGLFIQPPGEAAPGTPPAAGVPKSK